MWIELQLNNKKCAIGVVYRQYTLNFNVFSIDFLQLLIVLIMQIIYIIFVEININLLKYFNEKSVAYVDALHSLSCKVLLYKTTILTENAAMLI